LGLLRQGALTIISEHDTVSRYEKSGLIRRPYGWPAKDLWGKMPRGLPVLRVCISGNAVKQNVLIKEGEYAGLQKR
jgi:hypothetical protein